MKNRTTNDTILYKGKDLTYKEWVDLVKTSNESGNKAHPIAHLMGLEWTWGNGSVYELTNMIK